MSFPDLVARTGGKLLSENSGVPANGHNTFRHNLPIPPGATLTLDWLYITVDLDPGNTGWSTVEDVVFVSADAENMTLDFTQTGGDAVYVIAEIRHTIVR